MDPATVSALAAGAVTVLVTFLTKAGEKFSESVGEKIADLLAKKFEKEKDDEAVKVLEKVKEVPDSPSLQARLQEQVEKAVTADDELARALEKLLAEARDPVTGDRIVIDVKVSGHGQTGDIIGKVVGDVRKGK